MNMNDDDFYVRVPKLIDSRVVSELTGYTQNHLRRLENEGTFPKRINIGSNRVAWVALEVAEWIQERINERNEKFGVTRTILSEQDNT